MQHDTIVAQNELVPVSAVVEWVKTLLLTVLQKASPFDLILVDNDSVQSSFVKYTAGKLWCFVILEQILFCRLIQYKTFNCEPRASEVVVSKLQQSSLSDICSNYTTMSSTIRSRNKSKDSISMLLSLCALKLCRPLGFETFSNLDKISLNRWLWMFWLKH